MKNVWLARFVLLIHVIISAGIIATPFLSNNAGVLRIYLVCCLAIYMHWTLNDNICIITLIEMRARGIRTRSESLVHRIISPFFTKSVQSEVHAVESAVLVSLAGVAAYKLFRTSR